MLDLSTAPTPAPSADFEAFRTRAYALTGVDLRAYKAPQMYRRLAALMARHGLTSFIDYARLLAGDRAACDEFRDYVTINVSEFFRDRPRYDELEFQVLPSLLKHTRAVRAWSAGCSLGAEPYSLAILLLELAPERRHQILATDIDQRILERARSGSDYDATDVSAMSNERRARWFSTGATGQFSIGARPRTLVSFTRHDLIRDIYPRGPFDLIACRNVVIYFTEAAKTEIYTRFAAVLRPGGVLFVGGTEAILQSRALGLQPAGPGFFTRMST